MGPGEIYHVSRTRLLELAPDLTEAQLDAAVPPTPPWTALDVYRHLTGVCCDVLDGNMPPGGPMDTSWTAEHLASRDGWTIEEVCSQWSERGPILDGIVAEAGAKMGFVALDCWTHEQDARAATGVGALHDDELLPGLIKLVIGSMPRFYDGPDLRLDVGGEVHEIADDEPTASLTTTPYELMRMVFGRRSEAQVAKAEWSGVDAGAAQAAINLFPKPPIDIAD